MSTKEKSKEEAILEAAEQEFLDKGFDSAKTTNIASIAGVTHAMLHYYYRTKENLFNKILDAKVNLIKQKLFHIVDNPDMPFLDKVRLAVEMQFDFLRENPKLVRFVMNEVAFKPKRLKVIEKGMKKVADTVLNRMQHAIDSEVAKGNIVPIDPVTLVMDIASLNIFVFAALPVLNILAVDKFGGEDTFFDARRKEHVEIIMNRIIRR